MWTKLILTLCLLLASYRAAAEDFEHPLSIAELVDIALKYHPETRQAWWNANRAAAALGTAKSAYYPQADLLAQAKHGKDFKYINGPNISYTIFGAEIALEMLLYDFGERNANTNAAKMALLAANWHADWALQKVMVRVLENAYATIHAQEVLQAAYISQDEADKMLSAARDLNKSGLNPISDVYTSEATLSQMKMEVAQQKALLDIQRGKLATSIGISADIPLQLASVQEMPTPQMQQTADLIALAKKQRADLMAKQAKLSESFSYLAKARSAYGPKVGLTYQIGAERYLKDKSNGAHHQMAINFDIPLFDGFESTYQNRLAYADTQISTEELAQLELDISLEVLTYSRWVEAEQEMLCYAEDNLKNAQKAYEGVLEKYSAGKERIAEVSNALRQLATARVRFSDVKTRWRVSLANLAYATGTLAPYTEISTCEQNP